MKSPLPHRSCARGSALVISLILLAILTLVATAGMTTSLLELRMASGQQALVSAFQAADNAIETALACKRPARGQIVRASDCPATSVVEGTTYDFTIERKDPETSGVLPEGVSLGSEFVAVEYIIEASAAAGRGAKVELAQGFYELSLRE